MFVVLFVIFELIYVWLVCEYCVLFFCLMKIIGSFVLKVVDECMYVDCF